jgi:hypothetical protein
MAKRRARREEERARAAHLRRFLPNLTWDPAYGKSWEGSQHQDSLPSLLKGGSRALRKL